MIRKKKLFFVLQEWAIAISAFAVAIVAYFNYEIASHKELFSEEVYIAEAEVVDIKYPDFYGDEEYVIITYKTNREEIITKEIYERSHKFYIKEKITIVYTSKNPEKATLKSKLETLYFYKKIENTLVFFLIIVIGFLAIPYIRKLFKPKKI